MFMLDTDMCIYLMTGEVSPLERGGDVRGQHTRIEQGLYCVDVDRGLWLQ